MATTRATTTPVDLLRTLRRKPVAFNEAVLGRGRYWRRQRQIARSVVRYPTTLVPTGNMVGKTYLAAGLIHWFLWTHENSIVLATAPSQTQLEEVLWKEVERAYWGARAPLGGRLLRSPLKIEVRPGWHALAYSTTKVERLSGHHADHVLIVVDEASGVTEPIYEALRSCGPTRELLIGNPLWPDGTFYERCTRAAEKPGGLANVIQISSLESPYLPANWLESNRNDYGEGSLWWTTHVLGLFPDAGEDTLLPRTWLDRAEAAGHAPRGPNRLTIDLAEGKGGDRTVLLVRDDNGVRHMESSPNWPFETAASRAALLAQRWGVEPQRVTFDASGIGADFGNRLEAVGLKSCQPYRGGLGAGKSFGNLRTAAAFQLRRRLDPERRVTVGKAEVTPPPFAIPPEFMRPLRPELQAIRWTHNEKGVVCLEPKEDLAERLRHSPDHADALIMAFAFPDV